jgi:hypothetical protein
LGDPGSEARRLATAIESHVLITSAELLSTKRTN